MVRRGAIADTKEQREIYGYGMELQIYYIIHAVLLIGIGLLFGQAFEVAFLLFLFGMIQSNGGGYHAETHGKCLGIMAVGVLIYIALLPIYLLYPLLQTASVLFGWIVIICLAPVAHKNHPLSPEKSKTMGKRAKFLACIISTSWFLLLLSGWLEPLHPIISTTMFFSGISMIAARIKKMMQ
jgi:accessory gene regulator B